MAVSKQNGASLRLLVAIASYGEKNLAFLQSIIETYRKMPMDIDVVVLTDAMKSGLTGARMLVGLPHKNPWSLPFAHKELFARNAEQYDLFVYSEDDIGVSEENIRSFVRASSVLEADEIAGFLRYENDPDGARILTDVHASFHWKPESARRRGDYTVAEFTNEHAGFYILTQAQLKKAIASGGFLQSPCEGRYGMPETAATDPYTSCGFRKVINISEIEGFLVHHLPNRYAGRLGLPFPAFKEQLQTLAGICKGDHPISKLCDVDSKMMHLRWSKSYYEKPCDELIKLIPREARDILSIGCGWGSTEGELKRLGASVTAFPLDSVIGAAAARQGIDVIYGTLDECLDKLGDRSFDCVIISNLLHLQPEPGRILSRCSRCVREGGILLVAGPNFSRIPILVMRAFGARNYRKLRDFDESGISVCGPGTIAGHIRSAGFRPVAVQWHNHAAIRLSSLEMRGRFGRFTARDWIMQARKMNGA